VVSHASAGPLDPLAFPSLGDFPVGAFTINTTTVTIDNSLGVPLVTGVDYKGIAVFDFTTLSVGSINIVGTRPLALLSRDDATIGTLDVSAPPFIDNHIPNPGGPGGYASRSGPGAGGDGFQGGNGEFAAPGGGGSAGRGGNGGVFLVPGGIVPGGGGMGGMAYLVAGSLQGGSGAGGVFSTRTGDHYGGGGGGAIEVGAIGTINVENILANGASSPFGGGGGGSIFLHGYQVNLSGSLSARGGDGAELFGGAPSGGGGGGAVLIQTAIPFAGGSVDVSGGSGGSVFGTPFSFDGESGIFLAIPEPSSLVLLGIGLLGTLGAARFCRKSREVTPVAALAFHNAGHVISASSRMPDL
jgi:hypothetical protein